MIINKKIKNFVIIKKFFSGLILKKYDLTIIKKRNLNIREYVIIVVKNKVIIKNKYNDKNIYLLLKKKEIGLIIFFLKKKYKCILLEIFKIKNLFKICIAIVKPRMTGFDVEK